MKSLNIEFRSGIQLFNQAEYFECHELLEDVWRRQDEPIKQITQAIIQIAVAFYHLNRDNPVGAEKLLTRALGRLVAHQNLETPIDVADLICQTNAALTAIRAAQRPNQILISMSARSL